MTPSATLIPIATAVQEQLPPLTAQPAVTAEEAEALARRIRVESKIPRLALVGTILGIVFGIAAIWPFTDSNGYMADAMINGSGVFAFLPGWLLAGMLPLLAFYASRLHYQSKKLTTTRELEISLRKIRRILFWAMLAAAAAFIAVSADRSRFQQESELSWMPLLYVACFAACATIVGDVRRGLGDFDSEHQRRRRRLVRGFQVELVPSGSPASPSDDEDIPLATAVAPAPQPPGALPPPLPRAAAAAVPVETANEDEHAKDLRLFLTLAIVVGICVHAVRIGEIITHFDGNTVNAVMQGALTTGVGLNPVITIAISLIILATYLLVPCGLLWILWGVRALNYGPGMRSAAILLAVTTLILSAVVILPSWIFTTPENASVYNLRGFHDSALASRLARAPEIVHAALICCSSCAQAQKTFSRKTPRPTTSTESIQDNKPAPRRSDDRRAAPRGQTVGFS